MEAGIIQNLIDVLEKAFKQLNMDVSVGDLETLAVAIHRTLSMETRRYHTPEHVLSLTDPSAPIRSLAAVFHDLVYYEIDRGVPSPDYAILAPYLLETDNDTLVLEKPPMVDRSFELLRDMFAISLGQAISSTMGIILTASSR